MSDAPRDAPAAPPVTRHRLLRTTKRGRRTLSPKNILFTSFTVMVQERVPLAKVAFLTLAPLALVDGILSEVIEHFRPEHSLPLEFVVVGAASGLAITLGTVFLGGVVDHMVGQQLMGHDRPAVRSLISKLEWRRLILADVAVTVLVVLTSGFGVFLGGLLLLTLFALVGPLVNIEQIGVGAAFKRSVRLVLRHPVWVLVLCASPLVGEHILVEAFEEKLHHAGPLSTALVQLAVTLVVLTYVALVQVCTCHALLESERQERLEAAAAPTSV